MKEGSKMTKKHCALFDCFLISGNSENIESRFCNEVRMKSVYCELCKCQENHLKEMKEVIMVLNKNMWQSVKEWFSWSM